MIRLIFLLVFLIWNVDGVKGVMPDFDVHPSDDEDYGSGSGNDEDEIPCCNIGTAKLTNSYELYLKPAISRDELDVRIRNKFRDTLDTPIV